MMRKLLQILLRWEAVLILRKYRPKIVAVSGSVGKTSAKEAIFLVLSGTFQARKSEGNLNTEIGVPLTIIGAEGGKSSLIEWITILLKGLGMILARADFPEILVLEYGADRPGDIKYLVKNFPPAIGVITAIGETPVHLEFYKNRGQLVAEKALLIRSLPPGGAAVLNADDADVLDMEKQTRAKIIIYGEKDIASMRVGSIELKISKRPWGMYFRLETPGSVVPVFIPNLLGRHQLNAILAAAAVGMEFGMNTVEIAQRLARFIPPKGRLNLLPGIRYSLILDDSYNSSPAAAIEALKVLKAIPGRRRIAFLGDMLELGPETENAHKRLGRQARELELDMIVAVGYRAQFAAEEAMNAGMPKDNIIILHNSEEAVAVAKRMVTTGDVVLVKGSQGMRMEKVVKAIMAEPEKADELLVRQTPEWLGK